MHKLLNDKGRLYVIVNTDLFLSSPMKFRLESKTEAIPFVIELGKAFWSTGVDRSNGPDMFSHDHK